jgi:hypothetical protein
MPSYHLHASNDAEQIYTGKHVELIVAQGHPQKHYTSFQRQENYLLSHWHLRWTWQLTVPHGVPETQPSKPLHYTWPTQTPLQQAGYHTVWLSSMCRGTPIYGQSKYMDNMHILCGTMLRTSSPRIRNYVNDGETGTGGYFRLSHAAPWHICTAQVITAIETTFTISGAHNSCNVPSDRFNMQFRLRHGSPTRGHNPQ